MWPRLSSTGTVSVNLPDPASRSTGDTASPTARYSTNSVMPPRCAKLRSSGADPSRSSRTTMVRPGTRKVVCWAREYTASTSIWASEVKICSSGQKRTRVPVLARGQVPSRRRPDFFEKLASGPSPSNTPGMPRRKDIRWIFASRSTSMSSRELNALTTLAPTPCRPPEAVYEPPPNLPPACSLVITTSTPVSFVRGSTSTGMPRPSSWTSTEPSARRMRSIRVHQPPRASSTELSRISHKQCMSPRESVDPMYIPGRLRTASSPSSTDRCLAEYPPDDVSVRRARRFGSRGSAVTRQGYRDPEGVPAHRTTQGFRAAPVCGCMLRVWRKTRRISPRDATLGTRRTEEGTWLALLRQRWR